MKLLKIVSFLLPFALVSDTVIASDIPDDSLYSCDLSTPEEVQNVGALQGLDIFQDRYGVGSSITVRSSTPESAHNLLQAVSACVLLTNNLLDLLENKDLQIADHSDETGLGRRQSTIVNIDTDPFYTLGFPTFTDIVAKMTTFANIYPKYAFFNSCIGLTHEGRAIPSLLITDLSVPASSKKMIWFNGMMHAREWIAPVSLMYVADKLLRTANTTWMRNYEIVITPAMNPDGYVFSMATSANRLWRKNRNPAYGTGNEVGADLNRNWDDHYKKYGTIGLVGSDTYPGSMAWSEKETKVLRDYVNQWPLSSRLWFIDFHAYGSTILRPWGWTKTLSNNEAKLKLLGDGMASAAYAVNMNNYTSSAGIVLYPQPVSGCADDWAGANGFFGFTFELKGTNFIVDKSEIVKSGRDMSAAVLWGLGYITDKNYSALPKLTVPAY